MEQKEKTPFRKNLDKRYISGEDLLNGVEMKKGLRKEMVVTFVKFNDAPAFDQKLQKEVDKTAIWLKEYPNGKTLYKPCLLNVERAEFMSKELANGSMFIDDCDDSIPFVIYAKPDRRHGHVVAFRKYYAPSNESDTESLELLSKVGSLDDLKLTWESLTPSQKKLPTVVAKKDELKKRYS